jgi:hypothetical protein
MTLTLSTIIQTRTVMFGTTFVPSLTELIVVTHVWSSELLSRTLTLTASLTEMWMATFIDVPIYYSSALASGVNIIVQTPASEAQKSRQSDAVLIGVVTGAAGILALLVGEVIFLIKRRGATTVTPEWPLDEPMIEADHGKAVSPDLGNSEGYEDGELQVDPARFDLSTFETLDTEIEEDDVAEVLADDRFIMDNRAIYL